MYKYFIILSIALMSGVTLAAAKTGHVPSIMDLKYPALNFILLFGFMFIKLRKPLSNMFSEKSKSIKESFDLAEEKSKEAKLKYDMYAKKMEHLNREIDNIMKNADVDVNNFATEQEAETQIQVKRLEKDALTKVESEKSQLMDEMNHVLINNVISQAKEKIASNSGLKDKASQKLVSHI